MLGVFGASWERLGPSRDFLSLSWPVPGRARAASGPLWALSWGALGAHLGCQGSLQGRLRALLGASWAVLERHKGPPRP
eukprot:8981676-Pyramimonas_sp.AAC.1